MFGDGKQKYRILGSAADDEKDFDFETEYSKNTQIDWRRLEKIRIQEVLKCTSTEGMAYKVQAKRKCYQTGKFDLNCAQI